MNSSVSIVLAACLAAAPSCAYFTKPTVGVRRVGADQLSQQLEASALTGATLSSHARLTLHYFGMSERFDEDPAGTLVALHESAAQDALRDFVYGLAELSYFTARWLDSREHYLAAAVYAYCYLLDDDWSNEPNPYDRSFRWACEIYNRGLREALISEDRSQLEFAEGRWKLPVGFLDVTLLDSIRPLTGAHTQLLPADEYEVWGLSMRLRDSGLGVPFVARSDANDDKAGSRRKFVPGSALLRIEGGMKALANGHAAVLELRSGYDTQQFTVREHTVPIESDFSAALGLALNQSSMWGTSLTGFFDSSRQEKTNGLKMIRPYDPHRIPVVFVHGTASSPGNWAEMFNLLFSDPALRERYQFWFFQYSTGNPVLLSAQRLREALIQIEAAVDREGDDYALQHMVLVGHSQGGLLCKMQVVDGDVSWWEKITGTSLAESGFSPENEATLRGVLDFDPLPFVDRVIFLSTPHGGSYLADHWLARFVNGLVELPREVVSVSKALQEDERFRRLLKDEVPTSVRGMSPSSPFVRLLSDAPVRPGVHMHSIIAIGDADPKSPTGATDGLVQYESAHIEDADSEACVPGGHSCQSSPSAIREVRRILREHIEAVRTTKP